MACSATEMANKLAISRSYLYYLKDNGIFEIEQKNGKFIWDNEVYEKIYKYLQANKNENKPLSEKHDYKTTKINNRRYLGNKYKLLSFIKNIVSTECENINTVADIFSGTGAVASAFTDKKLITNDMMYSNYICHLAWFSSKSYSETKIKNIIYEYNHIEIYEDNYMSNNFANTYFSLEDCRKIGYIRENIEIKFNNKSINERERAMLITSLLYAMDKIANTCGHYDAYRKGGGFERQLELAVPTPEGNLNPNNVCFNVDSNILVKEIEADLVYIDPPYNSRQYCDAYHLLENVAKWEKPAVFGVAKKMDRTTLKSDYCTQKATQAFENLIKSVKARYILLSYNNMAEKGNDRSNAKISDVDIMRILSTKGIVKVFAENYKAFSAGKSEIKENQERLFLCKCYTEKKEYIPSALNYTGGKYKLLPQIEPFFPQNMSQVIDMFCGGCSVGINVGVNRVRFNDSNENLIGLLNTLKELPKDQIIEQISGIIDKFGLSMVSKNGYKYYECESSSGLGKYNKDKFLKLRQEFNSSDIKDYDYYLKLYVLIVYSFNNQLRFNRKGEFNLPVGKRDFNAKMRKKLEIFIDKLKCGDYLFTHGTYRDIAIQEYDDNSFFYADPPYLITCATYNEQGGWTEENESELLQYLKEVDRQGKKFALSNVLESKGKINHILQQWIYDNPKYTVIDLNYNYSNSNYQTKQVAEETKEILVINY